VTIKVGYEQFVPPRVPPGMYFDRDTWLILPLGVRPAEKGRVAASWFLGVDLFAGTRVLHDPDRILPRLEAIS
jgi:hypothetical protein